MKIIYKLFTLIQARRIRKEKNIGKAFIVLENLKRLQKECKEPLYLFQLMNSKWVKLGELKKVKVTGEDEIQLRVGFKKILFTVSQSKWHLVPYVSKDKLGIKDIKNNKTYVIGELQRDRGFGNERITGFRKGR